MNNITLSSEGRRIYIVGNSYSIKEKIKSAGGHWDTDRKQWWVGAGKKAEMEAAIAKASGATDQKAKYDGTVIGKVKHTSKAGKVGTYFAVWSGVTKNGPAVKLVNFAGDIEFWADESAVEWVKHYRSDNPPTLKSIQEYAQEKKTAPTCGRSENRGWVGNGCSDCRRLQDWCKRCAFDEFDN